MEENIFSMIVYTVFGKNMRDGFILCKTALNLYKLYTCIKAFDQGLKTPLYKMINILGDTNVAAATDLDKTNPA